MYQEIHEIDTNPTRTQTLTTHETDTNPDTNQTRNEPKHEPGREPEFKYLRCGHEKAINLKKQRF